MKDRVYRWLGYNLQTCSVACSLWKIGVYLQEMVNIDAVDVFEYHPYVLSDTSVDKNDTKDHTFVYTCWRSSLEYEGEKWLHYQTFSTK